MLTTSYSNLRHYQILNVGKGKGEGGGGGGVIRMNDQANL